MTFSFKRFLNLLRIDLFQSKDQLKVLLFILGGFWILQFLLFTLLPSFQGSSNYSNVAHYLVFGTSLALTSIWAASQSLSSFHRTNQFPSTLSIPGSFAEHFAKAWTCSFVVIPALVTLAYGVFAYAFIPLVCLIPGFQVNYDWFVPSASLGWMMLIFILIRHSIFMLGSITFARYPLIKTLIILIGCSITLLILGIITIGKAFVSTLMNAQLMMAQGENLKINDSVHETAHWLLPMIGLIVVLFYVVTILKIREKQG